MLFLHNTNPFKNENFNFHTAKSTPFDFPANRLEKNPGCECRKNRNIILQLFPFKNNHPHFDYITEEKLLQYTKYINQENPMLDKKRKQKNNAESEIIRFCVTLVRVARLELTAS